MEVNARPIVGHVVSALYPRQAFSAIGIHAVKSVAQLCTLLLLPPFCQCVKSEGCTCYFIYVRELLSRAILGKMLVYLVKRTVIMNTTVSL